MRPHLKTLVQEAAQALSALKADQLEDFAHACQAINRDLSLETKHAYTCELLAARKEMAALAKILDVTRANVRVIERIRLMRTNRLEYAVLPQPESNPPEVVHGLD